jgi:diadenosine tetraphosphate (Ap4A) HIT family hydrolase
VQAAGQVVPHVHFHIIPRRADDNLFKFPGSGAFSSLSLSTLSLHPLIRYYL